MTDHDEIPESLKALAAELDALGGQTAGPDGLDGLPDLHGTDFVPLAELGRGGMGIVYSAAQVSLDRTVAVKVLAPQIAGDASCRDRFVAESRLVAQLHHPNIIDVYAAGSVGSQCYFAMEFIDGTSADRHEFRSPEEVVQLGLSLAEALSYAHRCGVLHRDIKPANILIAGDGTVKLGDFGLACLAESVSDRAGTTRYMAPELKRGESATPATDQYALGATLLVLTAPFGRDRDLAAILDKATAEDPDGRYPSLDDLTADLRHYLAHEPITARPASCLRRLALWSRRNPAACYGTLAAACCLLGLFAALAFGYIHAQQADSEAARARAESERAQSEASQAKRDLGRLRYFQEAHRRMRERRENPPDSPRRRGPYPSSPPPTSPRTPGRE